MEERRKKYYVSYPNGTWSELLYHEDSYLVVDEKGSYIMGKEIDSNRTEETCLAYFGTTTSVIHSGFSAPKWHFEVHKYGQE